MQMVVDSVVSHPSKTTEVPHLSETKALTTTEVTMHTCIELFSTNHMDITPHVETNVTAPVETEVTTLTLIELSVHRNEWFP